MEQKPETRELLRSAHLIILNCYTVFSVILLGEALLLGWEKWALVVIVMSLVLSWTLYIRQRLDDSARIWIYSILMMVTYFFYGVHESSTFDIAAVMIAVIMMYTMTAMRPLITLCQITFYVTFAFDLGLMFTRGRAFDSLVVTRSLLHIVLVTAAARIARIIIDRWNMMQVNSGNEIANLKDLTTRFGDYLANISHEIRTPVNAVIGLADVCMEKEENEEIRQDLFSIASAGKRVGEQVSDILDFSEIDMNSLSVNNEDYLLSSVLNDLVEELKPYGKKDVELIIDVDVSLPSVMNTDVYKLKKIFKHLILNGIKYTQSGGVYVRLYKVDRNYGINLCAEVTDTGIGMSKNEIERVFDRFYQADSGRTRSTSGLGLGLSIVNGFVRSLGGFLTIESEPGLGTTVKISLPQKVVDDTPCLSVRDQTGMVIAAYLHFEKFDDPHVRDFYGAMVKNIVRGLNVTMHRSDNLEGLKKLASGIRFTHLFVGQEEYGEDVGFMESLAKHTLVAVVADDGFMLPEGSQARLIRKPLIGFPFISILNSDVHEESKELEKITCTNVRALVVDDEPMNLTVAKGILRRYEMTVETAESGMEAIERSVQNDYDIIFMDHMMPKMDGIEAMKRIRSELSREKKNPDVPIVALTANALSAARERFLKEGFNAFLSKPIERFQLERVIKTLLPSSKLKVESIPEERVVEKPKDPQPVFVPEEEPAAEPDPTQDNPYASLERLGVDTGEGLIYCDGEDDFYQELLLQFGQEAAEKRARLQGFFDEKDLPNYSIFIHAVKSTAKLIGALSLSEKARALEKAATNGDMEFVEKNHDEAIGELQTLADQILADFDESGSGEDFSGEVFEFELYDENDDRLPEGGYRT